MAWIMGRGLNLDQNVRMNVTARDAAAVIQGGIE